MYTIQPKKMVIINILDILKKYTDVDHRLTQKDIEEILKKEYNMEVDRKTVKRNLMNLLDMGLDIEYTETIKMVPNKETGELEETSFCTDWYMTREFSDSELRLLIDGLLFSKNIPHKQCKELIEKLKGLSNVYFDKKVKHIYNLPDNQPRNKEVFYTIDVLDEAISKKKKVAFTYNSYGIDKKLHPRREKPYIINPYQLVATNGKYYLICNYDKFDNIVNYRVDKITNVQIIDEPCKPVDKLVEGEINLPKHMAEHLYMFAGESVRVKFKTKTNLIDQVIDWFGKDVDFTEKDNGECIVRVLVNKEAFFYWAMQYGLHVEVMEPLDLRQRVIDAIKSMGERYGISEV